MPLIIKNKNDGEKTPHLALTHNDLQGGAANMRNVSLLMKNKDDLGEDVIEVLKGLGIDLQSVDKAAFYSKIRDALRDAVKEKYGEEDKWLYVEDFSDSVVIFCNDKGIFSTNYSEVDGMVVVDDLASPVVSVLTYEPTTGKMLLSEDAEDKLEEGVYGLVTKALEKQETVEHFIEVFKSIDEVKVLEKEIQKAVEAAEAVLKAQLADKETELTKALEKLEAIEKAQKEAVEKSRKAELVAIVGDEEAESLMKAVGGLEDEAFAVIVKSLDAKVSKEDESDLLKEKGVSGEGKADEQEKAGLNLVGDLIKKQQKKN